MDKIKVHFMGICGSGATAAAIIANNMGFEVSGCDLSKDSYYVKALMESGINIIKGHNVNHLDGIDILAVSPAVFDISPDNPELVEAKARGILMTWQEFMGKYLQKNKTVVSIAGTHGKTTSTLLTGVLLEGGELDPTVIAGSSYHKWGKGCRIGCSDYYVCEADEFNRNFWNYKSSIAVINNLEMDHPEYYHDFNDLIDAYKGFIMRMESPKTLIVNEESDGIRILLDELREWIISNNIKVVGFYQNNPFQFSYATEHRLEVVEQDNNKTVFNVWTGDMSHTFCINMPGIHNVNNAMSAIAVAMELGIDSAIIEKNLNEFSGVGRRFELIGKIGKTEVYDDFGHHPSEISAVLDMCKNLNSTKKIWAVFEPHQVSRLRLFFNEYVEALNKADYIIITKTHIGREIHKKVNPITENEWLNCFSNKKNVVYRINRKIVEFFDNKLDSESDDIIVVFGAANSYKISRAIVKKEN